jgi:tetratricopeptide (TPR) repeat protein
VSEENEGPTTGPEGIGAGVDPVAAALALGGVSREDAKAFLEDQRALIADQRKILHVQLEDLREENSLKLSHLRIRRFSDYAKMALEISVGLLMLSVVSGLGVMVWNAAHADGLVIEEFSVPPDLAAKGMTGKAVAGLMLDKLTAMQDATASFRPAKSYSNNWGNDLKVEIPDTGISFGEAYRFLRGWLGHETRISGEVYWIDKDIAINLRAGGEAGIKFMGPASNLDALIQKASEKVYGNSQPYRYANYLSHYAPMLGQPLRPEEAKAIFSRLTGDPNPLEQAWAWQGLSLIYESFDGNHSAAITALRKAITAYPDFPVAHVQLAFLDSGLGKVEDALAEYKTTQRLLRRSSVPEVRSDLVGFLRTQVDEDIAHELGDYMHSGQLAHIAAQMTNNRDRDGLRRGEATSLAAEHDAAAAHAHLNEMPPPPSPLDNALRALSRLQVDFILEDWRAVITSEGSVEKSVRQLGNGFIVNGAIGNGARPWLALAKARTGDIANAQSLVATTKGDCYDCVKARGAIAALAGEAGRADYWFARAIHDAPSIPFAYNDWGRALLDRGQPEDAIAKFKLANQKGPHFADPLEGWGEALMAKNQSHLAVAKFAEAGKYAPNWGRLHLKWGEALVYAGQVDEAKKQFARAAQLDLTPPEKSELARVHV